MLSFVLPPLLHLILVAGPNYRGEASVDPAQYEAVWSANLELTSSDPDVVSANGDSATLFVSIVVYLKSAKCIYYCDWILLVGGVFMTSVGTYITAVDVAARLARGIC